MEQNYYDDNMIGGIDYGNDMEENDMIEIEDFTKKNLLRLIKMTLKIFLIILAGCKQ